MGDIERTDEWLDALADYLSCEDHFTADKTVPHGESTVDGLRRAANDLRGAVEALREAWEANRDDPDCVSAEICRNALVAMGVDLTTNRGR